MKKTLITLLALAGAAVAGEEITLTLPDSQTLTLETAALSTTWDSILSTVKSKDYGLYYGGQNNKLDALNTHKDGNEGTWVNSNNVGAITMNGRDGVQGSAFVMVLGEELTQGTVITSISFSAKNKLARPGLGGLENGYVTLGLGIVDSKGEIIESSGGSTFNVGTAGTSNTQVLSLSNGITWKEGYKVIAVIDGAYGGGTHGSTPYILDNITVTATIPEPATATLSLLALAGLAARRRRK